MIFALFLLLASPAPAASPPCTRDATPQNIVTPDYPDSARKLKLGLRQVAVTVLIRADGTVQSASVARSSGNAALDAAAVAAASKTTYLPKTLNCKAVPGAYLFKVTFDPGAGGPPDACNHPAQPTYLSPPVYPRGHFTNKPVQVELRIEIAPDGTIANGNVATSSGDAAFDAAAIQAAELSRFEPKKVNCRPVAGTYIFKVTFMPH
jgi:TonB family protein